MKLKPLLLFGFIFLSSIIYSQSILHYPLDGNGVDISGNGFHATSVSAISAADRFGNGNSAMHFNGVNQIIDMPLTNALKPGLPFSISCWVRFESLSDYDGAIFTNEHRENLYSGFWLGINDQKVHVSFGDGGSPGPFSRRTALSTATIVPFTWYHIIAVVRGPTDMELYVTPYTGSNTTCVNQSSPWTYNGTGGQMIYFGNPYNGVIGLTDASNIGGNPIKRLKGTLDEFKIWDYALDYQEILDDCNGVVPCISGANFSSQFINSCGFQFTDLSTTPGFITSWLWNFDDPNSGVNNISTLQNPTHQFSGQGIYNVCLTATYDFNGQTCSDTYCENVQITKCLDTCSLSSFYVSNAINSISINTVDPDCGLVSLNLPWLPIYSQNVYVDWGDGSAVDEVSNTLFIQHQYPAGPGMNYTINISFETESGTFCNEASKTIFLSCPVDDCESEPSECLEVTKEAYVLQSANEIEAVYTNRTFDWRIQLENLSNHPQTIDFIELMPTASTDGSNCPFEIVAYSIVPSLVPLTFDISTGEGSVILPANSAVTLNFVTHSCSNSILSGDRFVNCFQYGTHQQPTTYTDEVCDTVSLIFGCPGGFLNSICIKEETEFEAHFNFHQTINNVESVVGSFLYDPAVMTPAPDIANAFTLHPAYTALGLSVVPGSIYSEPSGSLQLVHYELEASTPIDITSGDLFTIQMFLESGAPSCSELTPVDFIVNGTQTNFTDPGSVCPQISVTLASDDDPACIGSEIQAHVVPAIISANQPPYMIEWSNGSNSNSTTATDAGLLVVEVESAAGCTAAASIEIEDCVVNGCEAPTHIDIDGNLLVWEGAAPLFELEFIADNSCCPYEAPVIEPTTIVYNVSGNEFDLNIALLALQKRCWKFRMRSECSEWTEYCCMSTNQNPGPAFIWSFGSDCVANDCEAPTNIKIDGDLVVWEGTAPLFELEFIADNSCCPYEAPALEPIIIVYEVIGNEFDLNIALLALQQKCWKFRMRSECSEWTEYCCMSTNQNPGPAFIWSFGSDCQPPNCEEFEKNVEIDFDTEVNNCLLDITNNTTTGGLSVTYLWDFGDGTFSNEESPSHVFGAAENYHVCLTITSKDGTCELTKCVIIQVRRCTEIPNCPFPINWLQNANPGCGLQVFGVTPFLPSGATVNSYHWDFGDGVEANGQDVTHFYQQNGVYEVCLSILVDLPFTGRCRAELCREVNISECFQLPRTSKESSLSGEKGILVYPNPASQAFNIRLSNKKEFIQSWTFLSNTGQLVDRQFLQNKTNEVAVLISDKLAKGLYMIRVDTENQTYTQKIMIQ